MKAPPEGGVRNISECSASPENSSPAAAPQDIVESALAQLEAIGMTPRAAAEVLLEAADYNALAIAVAYPLIIWVFISNLLIAIRLILICTGLKPWHNPGEEPVIV